MGDHPPITPVRSATVSELGTDAWRLYDYICRHFLGSLSSDCILQKTKFIFSSGGERFSQTSTFILQPGFTSVMHWRVRRAFMYPLHVVECPIVSSRA